MKSFCNLFCFDLRRRSKDSFLIGYNIVFPIFMIVLLGYLSSKSYGHQFTGYQYYSIVMPSFCTAMAIITAAFASKDDAYKKTAVRFLFAPIPYAHIVLSKLLSCTLVISCCNVLVLLTSRFVFHLPAYGEIIPISLLLMSESFTVCAIGLFIGLGMKNFIFIKNIVNIPICVAAILAGAFFPIGTLNHGLEIILMLSPLTWINRSIFLVIYDNSCLLLWRTSIVFVIVGIAFTILAIKCFRKEEFIYGDLPGYDK